MHNSKLSSAGKKIKSIIKHGTDPIAEGVVNFESNKPDVEALAVERAKICATCPKFQQEPIEFLRVKDERIPQLSEKFCDGCGCTASYKLRQSLIICPLWLK